MQKKTVAVTILSILILFFIVAIGSTLSAFKVSKEKVTVKSISVLPGSGIVVLDNDGNQITELKVKSSSVGVRPATGEEDSKTNIPTTVNDAVGTEGAYACFKLSANSNWEILLSDCKVSVGEDENLDNVRIGIMEEENDPISGKDVGSVLAKGGAVEGKEVVVVVWLDQETTKTIKGAEISIILQIVNK